MPLQEIRNVNDPLSQSSDYLLGFYLPLREYNRDFVTSFLGGRYVNQDGINLQETFLDLDQTSVVLVYLFGKSCLLLKQKFYSAFCFHCPSCRAITAYQAAAFPCEQRKIC